LADHGVEGITCTVTTEMDDYALTIPAPGEHMAYAASIAVAVGEELGLSHDEIVRGVAAFEPTGSRMRVVRLPEGRIILDDCYNANPQSVTAALEVLGRTACDRRVAVLGDMGELGDLTDQAHYNMGALAAMLGIDFVVAIGEKAAKIADGASQSGGEVVHFATIEEAIPTLKEQLCPGCAMLVKASHAMRFDRLVEQLRGDYD
jgi:UDP-N-acetylmuramoyl-tripeptide--D-alanyl-D-alanine ligase